MRGKQRGTRRGVGGCRRWRGRADMAERAAITMKPSIARIGERPPPASLPPRPAGSPLRGHPAGRSSGPPPVPRCRMAAPAAPASPGPADARVRARRARGAGGAVVSRMRSCANGSDAADPQAGTPAHPLLEDCARGQGGDIVRQGKGQAGHHPQGLPPRAGSAGVASVCRGARARAGGTGDSVRLRPACVRGARAHCAAAMRARC